jgi:hypothetical protein
MSDTILDLASDLALAQARRAEICRKAGATRSDQRTTEQRRQDAKKNPLTDEQYRANAFRTWATRRDRKP